MAALKRLGVGFVGSGFNARFHMQGWRAVRDADVLGVWSPNKKNAESAAQFARELGIGAAKAYRSISEMVDDPAIDAIWLTGPNHARVENVEEIVNAVESGRGSLVGIACEKPLARNVAEARQLTKLVQKAELKHGYLENQLFALPRNTADHTCRGSGGASCRAVEC
jgi:predicted dehydrogenase